MARAPNPAYINIPQPGSNPETPSEIPGTPTSTTTSLSALSTTAIKDGQRGHLPGGPLGRGHQHTPSTTSLEAERADRISRLAGLERVSTLRAPLQLATSGIPGSGGGGGGGGGMAGAAAGAAAASGGGGGGGGSGGGGSVDAISAMGAVSSLSPQTTPTSTTGFPANFPASHNLTPSYFDVNGQPVAVTKMSTVGTASATEGSHHGDDVAGSQQTVGDGDGDEDMLSTDTNYRGTAESVASMAAEPDAMDEDMDEGVATRSVGGYEDRMSDDGSASLVGFGEGANSTVSGPIYHRRPVPGPLSQSQQPPWAFERTSSGFSADVRRDRDIPMTTGFGGDVPASAAALQERREARMMDGVAADTGYHGPEYEPYVDTTFRGPVPMTLVASRVHHHHHQQQQQQQQQQPREGAERVGQPLGNETFGAFPFESEANVRRD